MLPILAVLMTPVPEAPTACPLGPAWGGDEPVRLVRNTLAIESGSLTWNGAPLSDKLLRRYLAAAAGLSPRPAIRVDTTGMDCARLRSLAARIEVAGPCTPALCQAYALKRGTPPPAPPAPGSPWYPRRR